MKSKPIHQLKSQGVQPKYIPNIKPTKKFPGETPIIKKEKKKQEKMPEIDHDKIVDISIKSRYNKLKFLNQNQEQPFLIQLTTQEVDIDQVRPGLDLVFCIDISSSMSGNKLKLVKETLVFILDQLEDEDRVCLIAFDNQVQIKANFTSMTEQNKKEFKGIINQLETRGSTDLLKAIDISMQQIQQRKHINEFTAIFILSDGCDTCGNDLNKIKQAMVKRDKKINTDYQIHSFGYGDDHDEKILSAMREFKNGKFYFINKDDIVDECFIDCMGSLLTVIGKQVEIKIKFEEGFKIMETHGKHWKAHNGNLGLIQMGSLTSDNSYEYFALVNIPILNLGNKKICEVILTYFDKEKKIEKKKELFMDVINEDLGEINQEVEEASEKAQTQKVVTEFNKLKTTGNEKEAKLIIENHRNRIMKNDLLSKGNQEKFMKIIDDENLNDQKKLIQAKEVLNNEYVHGFSANTKLQQKVSSNMIQKKKMTKQLYKTVQYLIQTIINEKVSKLSG